MLIPGEEVSRVVLPGLEITMPASKNELGFELGRLIIMLGRILRGVSRLPFGLSRTAGQVLMIHMMTRATSIINDNPDIVVRVTE